MIQESALLTGKEINVINKKLSHQKLTQQDSNYLSRFIRPKLREMMHINSRLLLKKLEYNQKAASIEKKITALMLRNIKNVASITLYGSVIYSHYANYNDIDALVAVKKKFWKKLGDKYRLIKDIKRQAKGLGLDVKIFTDKEVYESYPSNIMLIYELKESKTIYGELAYPDNIKIDSSVLNFHMDYSYFVLSDIKENGLEGIGGRKLYSAIRNLWTIRLIADRIIDNEILIDILNSELGKNTVDSLKQDKASLVQKKISLLYLEELYKNTEKTIKNKGVGIVWEGKMPSAH